MDKVERLAYLVINEIKDRPDVERFTADEYLALVRRVRDFCRAEVKRVEGRAHRG